MIFRLTNVLPSSIIGATEDIMIDDIKELDPDEELDPGITPTPLSEPVITAIFQNAEVSGLAVGSLINATLDDSGVSDHVI